MQAIARRGPAVNEKFRTLRNSLVWALPAPAGELKRYLFWADALDQHPMNANACKINQLKVTIKDLERQCIYFDQLRKIMRIAIPETKLGLNDEGQKLSQLDIYEMESKLKRFIKKLEGRIRRCAEGADEQRKLKSTIKQLNKYWDKIFVSPIHVEVNGEQKIITPNRTNNTSEQFYRKIKQLLRRLHGRPKLTKDIDYLPEELTLIENLKNQDYIKKVIGSIDSLASEFAQLDIQNIVLPFEKDDSLMQVPFKIKHKLKIFFPLELVGKIA